MKETSMVSVLNDSFAGFFSRSAWPPAALTPALAQAIPARPVKHRGALRHRRPGRRVCALHRAAPARPLGQAFVVDNRPGAGAVIGTDAVAKSAPDGYTLLLMSNTHTVNETLVANKPYNLTRDFVGVAPINYSDLVLVATPSVPATQRAAADQGAKDAAGQAQLRVVGHRHAVPHGRRAVQEHVGHLYLVHIPYKGSSGARTDVIGGQVDVMFDAVTTMVEQVKAGKVKAIATTGKQRSRCCPTCRRVDEAGVPATKPPSGWACWRRRGPGGHLAQGL
jgi:tripartite-type tricarboxylate transporter receptor subunit TctC